MRLMILRGIENARMKQSQKHKLEINNIGMAARLGRLSFYLS